MVVITINDICQWSGSTPSHRNFREGERLVAAKHLLNCGIVKEDGDVFEISASCIQTSNVRGSPHEIHGILGKNGEVKSITCSCKAGLGEKCKHIMAALLFCSRSNTGVPLTMLHITEDTPPDMLAGAMDLTVHLPTGRNVKMAVERSTPMMDLLVQITTAHHLQLSNYTLQALGMAPSSDHRDRVLPYKPNTPIGTLDTQHIKVVPKTRTIPVPKNIPPGHQPFESTFRLKVHLPRNQLYVTRVSKHVLLEDIMKKMCEEKNLDPTKYEFKHPGNLDETLDPKLTLSDYQITEIYVVAKGTVSLSQAFSSSDIMALRKEEERKQMHNKTGGGVFNLIFRRGKSSMGSGSISSDTRSISPTHSDDSRSVTPPGVVQQPILPPPKQEPPPERPKPPQRKRRPAPKPPQQPQIDDTPNDPDSSRCSTDNTRSTSENTRSTSEITRNTAEISRSTSENTRKDSDEKPPSGISNVSQVSELQTRKADCLVISHSRTSSDSSGYHEASVLSENCNTSLPRRPKSAFVGSGDMEKLSKMHSQSSSNLSKMASHSKSTTSLGITGRKKKTAPPPPTAIRASNPQINIETASPVVASQSTGKTATPISPLDTLVAQTTPTPLPRGKTRAPPVPFSPALSDISTSSRIETIEELSEQEKVPSVHTVNNKVVVDKVIKELRKEIEDKSEKNVDINNDITKPNEELHPTVGSISNNKIDDNNNVSENVEKTEIAKEEKSKFAYSKILELQKESHKSIFSSPQFKNKIEQAKVKAENQIEQDKDLGENNNKESTPTNEIILKKVEDDASKDNFKIMSKSQMKLDLKNTSVSSASLSVDEESPAPVEKEKGNTSPYVDSNAASPTEKKLPEVVGIPKTPKDKKGTNKFDSFGKRRFQNSSLTGSFDDDSTSTKSGSLSTRTSIASALGTFNFIDEFCDLDDKVFSGSVSSKKDFSLRDEVFNQLYGVHNLDDITLGKNQSISSLRSLRSLPGFLNSGNGMKKWNNFEDLDDISLASQGPNSRWVIGESEPESLASHQALDSLDSSNNILIDNKDETKPFGSTDSGIAPEINEKLSESEDYRPVTPPPPPLFLDESPSKKDELEIQERVQAEEEEKKLKEKEERVVETPTLDKTVTETKEIERLNVPTNDTARNNSELTDIDWEYQLPSPPKAFRDSSPVIFNEDTASELHSITNFKDSIITSPELFEKLRSIEDTQSVITFVGDEPPLNTLSLENLEKRKSLVYNRELSTSLKVSEEDRMDPYANSLNQFESTFIEVQKSSQKEVREPKYNQKPPTQSSNTLPNFKISTYDRPKGKIKVFEDDTIRSNENGVSRLKKTVIESSYASNMSYTSNLRHSYVASSMENISVKKNSLDNKTGEREYTFFRPEKKTVTNYRPASSVFRSESFNKDNTWSPMKPVSRSRSHITLNGNKHIERQNSEEEMESSNSLYDVSGLQSLGVMRLIQNKLNTPTSSLENLNHIQDKYDKPKFTPEIFEEPLSEASPLEVIESTTTEKVYKYRGPPAINMGTWSDRPKVPVSVKEDDDYKLGNNISSKLIVNTTNNNITNNNRIEIKNNKDVGAQEPNISIKVNGTQVPTNSTEKKSGNVVIKIGTNTSQPKIMDSQTFINHTTATGYRKPFTDINKNQRPHSIAFGSDFDISRVPVVRSVELKKPYKDYGNTSVTHIYQSEPNQNGFVEDKKPVSKFGAFKSNAAPVVRGFRPVPKDKDTFMPNCQVPFSQGTLRRTVSSKIYEEVNTDTPADTNKEVNRLQTETSQPVEVQAQHVEVKAQPVEVNPPPPPMMPKVNLKKPVIRQIEPVLDPRDQLLSAIRNFGGKKGLKSVKV